jgi:hypothetical protein
MMSIADAPPAFIKFSTLYYGGEDTNNYCETIATSSVESLISTVTYFSCGKVEVKDSVYK